LKKKKRCPKLHYLPTKLQEVSRTEKFLIHILRPKLSLDLRNFVISISYLQRVHMKLNFLASIVEIICTNIHKGKQISPNVQLPCRTHSSAFNSQRVD
jgi:hypothetical protein